MLGLRAGWWRPTASVLTYGGEVVAAHRLGDGWARGRRTGVVLPERHPEHRAQRIDALRGLVVPDLRLTRAPPPSPAVAEPVRRHDLAAVREWLWAAANPPANPTFFVNYAQILVIYNQILVNFVQIKTII